MHCHTRMNNIYIAKCTHSTSGTFYFSEITEALDCSCKRPATAAGPVMSTHIIQDDDGHFMLASNLPLSNLTYDISQTHMLSWGFRGHSMQEAQFAAKDAFAMSAALVECGLVLQDKLRLCREEEECSTEAVKSAFKEKAQCVGENGLFIFSYHGPAVSCGSGHSLVSSDYKPDLPATHITSATILEWLGEVQMKPKQILCLLDCPSASEIAKPLTSPKLTTHVEKLCVLCGNTPLNCSLLTTALKHSLFTYFAIWAFKKCTKSPEQQVQRLIYVKEICTKIKECCMALNSLCASESLESCSAPAVMSLKFQPLLLQRFDDNKFGQDQDMIDGEVDEEEDMVDGEMGRFSFLQQHSKGMKKKHRLCDKGHQWLMYLKRYDSPLHVLCDHGILPRSEMIDTALRLIFYSLALTQDTSIQNSVGEANTFITLYMQTAGIVEHVTSTELAATSNQFELMFEAYCLALKQHNVSTSKISDLAKKARLSITTI